MNTHTYNCLYCHEAYIPRRRHVQKYCSNSCRSKAYHIRNRDIKKKTTTSSTKPIENEQLLQEQSKDSFISAKKVTNSTLGTLAAHGIISLFTKDENKTVTRKDFRQLLELQENRFHRVNNLPLKNGLAPYFDIYSGNIVYKTDTGVISEYNFLPA